MAGYNIPLAVEKDEWASETYMRNHKDTRVVTEDITQVLDLNAVSPLLVKAIGNSIIKYFEENGSGKGE